MSAPAWRGKVALRWGGFQLYVGRVFVGQIYLSDSEPRPWEAIIDDGPHTVHHTESAARAALLAAAIEALTGGNDGNG